MWIGGFICLLLGTSFNILAVGYGNLILMASFSAVTIVFNQLLSIKLLNENFSRYDFLALIFISAGSIMTLVYAKSESNKVYGEKELFYLFIEIKSVLYISISLFTILLIAKINNVIK
jgi:hypothetical protein